MRNFIWNIDLRIKFVRVVIRVLIKESLKTGDFSESTLFFTFFYLLIFRFMNVQLLKFLI